MPTLRLTIRKIIFQLERAKFQLGANWQQAFIFPGRSRQKSANRISLADPARSA
jgi:hypothetical protein